MGTDGQSDWQAQRSEVAAERAAALERQRATESQQARRIVADFVEQAHARGLRPQLLTARAYDGRARYRTNVTGWYVRRDRSSGIGIDGEFYVLSVPTSWRARVTGVRVTPTDPPLVIGAGGRDGESMPLAELLRQRLDAGEEW